VGEYSGKATVIQPKGAEHEVDAVLSSTMRDEPLGKMHAPMVRWNGRLYHSDAPWSELMDEHCLLRLPGGREGTVTVRHFDPAQPDGPVTITGSGAPPFD